jgi:hypothetical protein
MFVYIEVHYTVLRESRIRLKFLSDTSKAGTQSLSTVIQVLFALHDLQFYK